MSHPSSTASAAPGAADITVESSLTIALARDLGEFDLPTRLRNWAERAGIKTLGGLAAHSPGSLLEQRNLGRKSVAEAQARATPREHDEELLRHLGFWKEVGAMEQLNPLALLERYRRSRTPSALERGQG